MHTSELQGKRRDKDGRCETDLLFASLKGGESTGLLLFAYIYIYNKAEDF